MNFETQITPLFPLNIVLMPGVMIPLHIFEAKYKKMINNSINTGEKFGIVFQEKGVVREIGTFAKVQFLLKKYSNGEMDIIVSGMDKFLIKETYFENDFLMGKIEVLDDDIEVEEYSKNDILDIFNKIQKTFHFGIETDISLFRQISPLSYFLASKMGIPPVLQQELIEIDEEKERLKLILKFCEETLPQVKKEYQNYLKLIRN
ncbi:LON peptidase substrate-binding domain-containing protein [bacterium]|nr:LON peptidase substrate-binding domain-containing protein [bacterium]